MSNILISRVVDNIRAKTTVYTPVVETIVNSIQAIEAANSGIGRIEIRVLRVDQPELDDSLPDVFGFEIEDNGIGFNRTNRDSFDTLYSDLKIDEGGKGFGRFICLKYFENVFVESRYQEDQRFHLRKFSMGRENDIIENEKVSESEDDSTGTIVRLVDLKANKSIDKKLSTIARNLVERLLPYFIAEDFSCPEIVLSEFDSTSSLVLNNYIESDTEAGISEITLDENSFTLQANDGATDFSVRVFRLYAPRNQRSKISLVAHKREVSGSSIHKYVPEFSEEFYSVDQEGNSIAGRNYIVKAYVFGDYLDKHVSLERGGFEFQAENDALYGISQREIEVRASKLAEQALGNDVSSRREKKKQRIQSYVDENAPWHKSIVSKLNFDEISYNPSHEEIESRLQKQKFAQEMQIKRDVGKLLKQSNLDDLKSTVQETVERISDTSKNDLIHYIALRRNILELFDKSLQLDESGRYVSEGTVHDIIFPRRGDTDSTQFDDHNLWLIDERLNFSSYVASDLPMSSGSSDRPDMLVYDNRVLFRGDNEPSNPVTIFEFKKPQRDDFVNPSSDEDPVQQIVRYVNKIRSGQLKTPKGRRILIEKNTPFYGYVVCDVTSKVEDWLHAEKNFKRMPDGLGWFHWLENINLYIEVLSWDKVLKDSKMRNRIFFEKLSI